MGRRLVPEDLFQLEWLGNVKLSPEGRYCAYNVKKTNVNREGYTHKVIVHDLIQGMSKPYTSGDYDDIVADINERELLLLSSRMGDKDQQVYRLSLLGGEAVPLVKLQKGAFAARFSPDGKYVAVMVRMQEGESLELFNEDSVQSEVKSVLEPYLVDRLHYKQDGKGLWNKSYSEIALVEASTGKILWTTPPPYLVSEFSFSPDSSQIVFTGKDRIDDTRFYQSLYIAKVSTGEIRPLSEASLVLSAPEFSPDGKWISCYGHDMAYQGATQNGIYLVHVQDGVVRRLNVKDFIYEFSAQGMSDMRAHESYPGPRFTADGLAVLAPYSASGTVAIAKVHLTGEVAVLTSGEKEVYTYDFSPSCGQLLYAATDLTHPNDLFVLSLETQKETRLTSTNAWLQECELATAESFYTSADDGTQLQGWILKMDKAADDEMQPVILQVHGGPHAMFSYSFSLEFQLLASLGYAVVYGNPRGSSGYGQEFVQACCGDYGGGDYRDVMNILDAALNRDSDLDPTRLGVTGGSYGGFMTNWIVSHTNRFKAAVTQRSISNWVSFYGVSDIGYFFTEWEHKWSIQEDWGDPEKLWNISPLKYAQNVHTPLLIMHGEEDLRCPIEQAEQLYVVLKSLGKPVSFLRFPKSNHDLSRSGIPILRLARYEEMMKWFRERV